MTRSIRAIVLLVIGTLPAREAVASRFDFRPIDDTLQQIDGPFVSCGIGILPSRGPAISTTAGVGLGIAGGIGGTNDLLIDGTEQLRVTFSDSTGAPAARFGVRYRVEATSNTNGSGAFGESFVEAFDRFGASLGVVPMSGTGVKDVNARFAGAAIGAFELTASGDGVRISYIEYRLPPGELVKAHLTRIGAYDVNPLPHCGVLMTGSAPLLPGGVEGGVSSFLDGSEFVEFAFAAPVLGIVLESLTVTNANMAGPLGEGFIEAFGADNQSLGALAISEQTLAITDLFGGVPISAFRLTANGDGRSLDWLYYAPEPTVGSLVAILAILLQWRRARALRDRRTRPWLP